MAVLWNLSVKNCDNSIKIAAQGGIDAILTAMKAHPKVAAVQQEACGAICGLLVQNPNAEVEIAAKGGIEAILATMKEHLEDAEVQRLSCAALTNLSGNDGNKM